ncbi:unnamed protein product, partial [Heterosigma akashiwo]
SKKATAILGSGCKQSKMLSAVANSVKRASSHTGAAKRCLSSMVAMDLEFPGTPETSASAPSKLGTQTATLSNGVQVIASQTAGQSSSISVFVGAGSKYESSSDAGSALMLKTMAFKQTTERSDLRICRDLEDVGATPESAAGREHVSYTVSCLPEAVGTALEAVAETVLSPKLANWEVQELKAVANSQIEAATSNPSTVLSELLHAAAYGEESAMGHSFYSPVSKITGDSLKSFREKLYVGSNITLVGVNVGLDELKASAEPLFAGAASGSAAAAAASPYLGGELRMKADSPYTYLALAHEVADPAAAAALKAILDAKLRGSPLSLGARRPPLRPAGLVGLCGVCVPGAAPQALDGL